GGGDLVFLGRGGEGPWHRVLRAVRTGRRHLGRRGVGHLVRGRFGEPGARLRGPGGRAHPRRRGGRLGGRGGRGPPGHVPGAPGTVRPAGERPGLAGHPARRRGGHLPPDVARGRRGRDGVREAGRDLAAHLLRVRGRCGGPTPARRE